MGIGFDSTANGAAAKKSRDKALEKRFVEPTAAREGWAVIPEEDY